MTINIDTNSLMIQIRDIMNEYLYSDANNSNKHKILDKRQLANELGVSLSCIDQLRRDGLIQGLKIGKGEKSPVRFILEEVIMDLKNANRLE